ncbi:MAG TPA: GNAT family N-acetyltransferase [Bacteroidia bacterium]
MHWEIKKFEALQVTELYAIMQLRAEVFIVEQNCPYQDADGKDLKSFHLMGYDENRKLIVFARILPQNVSYAEVSIGRVVASPSVRGTGAGKLLMEQSLKEIETLFGKVPVRIGAQEYLKKFYEGFGFIQTSESYLEDNIPHIEMLRAAE